jgi:hypothetical protein
MKIDFDIQPTLEQNQIRSLRSESRRCLGPKLETGQLIGFLHTLYVIHQPDD